ncbi:MAG: hypothetical protein IJ137_08240 [Eubacterium sp.]|nr:hypothetical protein [Eubacterium sp.]
MNTIILKKNIDAERIMLKRCKSYLRSLPKGSLSSYSRNGKLYYKKYLNKELLYLGTDENKLVQKLKKRHLLEKMITILEQNLQLMEALLAGYRNYDPSYLQNRFKRTYQNVPEDLIRDLGFVINLGDTTFHSDNKIYKTENGLLVRSRIEALIANLYTKKGITFTYEAPVQLADGTIIHPDFTAYCPSTGKLKYHEHIGLLSDSGYLKSYLWKLEKYINNGLYPYYDVLFTYEKPNQGIDMNEIECLLDVFMR